MAIRGSVSLITFDDHSNFVRSSSFRGELYADELCSKIGGEVPSDAWDTVLLKQVNSILLKVKEGLFVSAVAKELSLWASQDGSALVDSFLVKCHKCSESDPSRF